MVWQKNCSQNEFHFLRYIHTLNYDKCFKAVDLQSFKHRLKWTNAAPARLGLLGLLFMPQKHICRWSAQPSCGFHLVDFEVSSMRLPIWRRHDPIHKRNWYSITIRLWRSYRQQTISLWWRPSVRLWHDHWTKCHYHRTLAWPSEFRVLHIYVHNTDKTQNYTIANPN